MVQEENVDWQAEGADVLFPYESFRPGQREAAEQIAEAVREGGIAVLRAPTGFGKTSTIIYALLKAGADKVLYLVRTVNEIDPVVRELQRFGSNYVFLYSAKRMCPLFAGTGEEQSVEDFWESCRLARLKGICEYYSNLENIDVDEIGAMVRGSGGSPPRRIVLALASKLRVCPFFALKKLVGSSQFIVATYPYGLRSDIFATALDPYTYEDLVVVIDEAHTLITAHQMLEQRLTIKQVDESIGEVEKYAREAKTVKEILVKLKDTLARNTPSRLYGPVRLDKRVLEWAFDEVSLIEDTAEEIREKKLEEAILSNQGLGRVRTSISRVEAWLKTLLEEGTFLFVEPQDDDRVYVATPMDPSSVVKHVIEHAKAVVLASGTLPRGDFVRELLGVDRNHTYIDTELLAGRFVSHTNMYTAVARDVTTRYRERKDDMFRRIASYITLISRALPGLKLAVYPSYDLMRRIAGKLPVGIPNILEDRRTSLQAVQEKILLTPDLLVNAVAGGKLVEGVEFVDSKGRNILHTVIIVGVPYPQPDAYTSTFEEVLASRIGRERAKYYVYTFHAIVRVLQALGRATRSPDDRAAYFLLDYRFLRKELREALRLPVKRVFSGIGGLQSALREAAVLLKPYSSSKNDSMAS